MRALWRLMLRKEAKTKLRLELTRTSTQGLQQNTIDHICGSRWSHFVFLFLIELISTPKLSVTDCPVLHTSVQRFAQWSPFLSGFPFLCYVRYQACGCLYSVFAVSCYLFMYLFLIALYGRCEWHYIPGECLASGLVTLFLIRHQQLRNCELTPGPV
jgi:hypothetical protein